MRAVSLTEVLHMLRERQAGQSGRAFALALGVSPAYLSDVYRRKREPGPALLAALGIEKVTSVTYRMKKP